MSGHPIRHLVVSRDGRFVWNKSKEVEAIQQVAKEYDCNLTMVEVTKSGPDIFRLLHFTKKSSVEIVKNSNMFKVQMPKSGVWWKLDKNTANLCTSGMPIFEGIPKGKSLPRPLSITKIDPQNKDSTPLEQIVKWMYHLSRVQAYTNKPTRLPIHLHLADRSAKDVLDRIQYPTIRGLHGA